MTPTTETRAQSTRHFFNKKRQPIGILRDGVFRKTAQKSKHFVQPLDSWGIEESVREELEGKCDRIEIFEPEEHVLYSTPYHVFQEKSFRRDFEPPQYLLQKKYWRVYNAAGHLLQERSFTREELQDKLPKLGI